MTVLIPTIMIAMLSSLITYYCCVKSKGCYSPIVAGFPAISYKTAVSTSGVSSLEIKDNMTCGHVATTSENTLTSLGVMNQQPLTVLDA